uniref:BPI2 domain-containing protein n=1 Tax=Gongylonema pulchrum TaxID=637853 RepID=A0A183D909_9BILA
LFTICIGKFFPDLSLKYPNRTIDLFIQSAQAPYVSIDEKGIQIYADSTIDLYLSPWKQQTGRLARLGGVFFFYVDELPVHSGRSGYFFLPFLEFLEKIMAESVKIIGEAALKVGIPMPLLDNVT